MSWRAVQSTDVLAEFTPAETALLSNIQGASTNLATILSDTVAEFVGAMNAAQYAVNTDGTIPDQLRRHVIARARWGWLVSFPQLKTLQTDSRKTAAEEAEKMLEKIARLEAGRIEPPAGNAKTGSWNSQGKLIMRTQPVPTPDQQGANTYANPAGPQDTD